MLSHPVFWSELLTKIYRNIFEQQNQSTDPWAEVNTLCNTLNQNQEGYVHLISQSISKHELLYVQ